MIPSQPSKSICHLVTHLLKTSKGFLLSKQNLNIVTWNSRAVQSGPNIFSPSFLVPLPFHISSKLTLIKITPTILNIGHFLPLSLSLSPSTTLWDTVYCDWSPHDIRRNWSSNRSNNPPKAIWSVVEVTISKARFWPPPLPHVISLLREYLHSPSSLWRGKGYVPPAWGF